MSYYSKMTQNADTEQARRAVARQAKRLGQPFCPRCYSTAVHAQRKGFGFGKAAAGGLLFGPLGVMAGGIGSKKVKLHCTSCGNKFDPGMMILSRP